jgi:hypothetical protein
MSDALKLILLIPRDRQSVSATGTVSVMTTMRIICLNLDSAAQSCEETIALKASTKHFVCGE